MSLAPSAWGGWGLLFLLFPTPGYWVETELSVSLSPSEIGETGRARGRSQ